MKKVYLDNAATTNIDPLVVDAMVPVLQNVYGNPSSIHSYGREARSYIEVSRKKVAEYLNVTPGEIFFTSGGTEADNMAIMCSVEDLGCTRIISSRTEHHAVLHSIELWHKRNRVNVEYVNLDEKGHIDLEDLERRLSNSKETTLVSLMHANNEIGNMIDINRVGELCKENNAYFHSDTVQTMGHFDIDLTNIHIHFVTCGAHKFHGPKGIGFLYINSDITVRPMIYGGAQERNMRGGTENIVGIVGLAKALEIAVKDVNEHHNYVQGLKDYMINLLKDVIPGVMFNGDAEGRSLYTVLNVCLPHSPRAEMLLYNLDIVGIACSAGSACSSGSNVGSHVLQAIGSDMTRPSLRFSFSRFNNKEEIEYCVDQIARLFEIPVTS